MGPPKNKWTVEEEQALRAGLVKYGKGKWRQIKDDPDFSTQLINRTNVDIKDKWRNWTTRAPAHPVILEAAPAPPVIVEEAPAPLVIDQPTALMDQGVSSRSEDHPQPLYIMAPPPPPPPSHTTLDLFPVKDPSSSKPQTQPPNNLKPMIMAEKAKVYKWEPCSIQTFPPNSLLKMSPRELCLTHDSLVNSEIKPKPNDDVYSWLPSKILEHRLPNGEGKVHVVYTKRNAKCRRFLNVPAEWVEESCTEVVGFDGEVVGNHFCLSLSFFSDGVSVKGGWAMEEFVSSNCLMGDTSVVVLKCSDIQWDRVELQVMKAEKKLLESHTKKTLVLESESELGLCICQLEEFRRKLKEAEEKQLLDGGVMESTGDELDLSLFGYDPSHSFIMTGLTGSKCGGADGDGSGAESCHAVVCPEIQLRGYGLGRSAVLGVESVSSEEDLPAFGRVSLDGKVPLRRSSEDHPVSTSYEPAASEEVDL